jgi:hypothetical protein
MTPGGTRFAVITSTDEIRDDVDLGALTDVVVDQAEVPPANVWVYDANRVDQDPPIAFAVNSTGRAGELGIYPHEAP